jgi:prolyl-tRNA synthetase
MLSEDKIEVLYDDRDESAGVKFNDADLLGMPLRITISSRSLSLGGAEVKLRRESEAQIIPISKLLDEVKGILHKELARYSALEPR